jgi:hypothetical protein
LEAGNAYLFTPQGRFHYNGMNRHLIIMPAKSGLRLLDPSSLFTSLPSTAEVVKGKWIAKQSNDPSVVRAWTDENPKRRYDIGQGGLPVAAMDLDESGQVSYLTFYWIKQRTPDQLYPERVMMIAFSEGLVLVLSQDISEYRPVAAFDNAYLAIAPDTRLFDERTRGDGPERQFGTISKEWPSFVQERVRVVESGNRPPQLR